MNQAVAGLLAGVVLMSIAATAARAAERPLWELAAGGGVVSLPHYRGAAENRVLPVPLLYPVYRGDVLKVDEEGVHGLLLDSERVKLDFSMDGTVPTAGEDIEVREGMPSLDATFQLGPSLTVDVWNDSESRDGLILTLPLRGVITVDTSPEYIGLAASPKMTYFRDVQVMDRYWRISLTGGAEFGSSKLHDYFYTVDPEFETANRPSFRADSGYAGTRFTLGVQSRRGNSWIGAFVRYDNVSGAAFEDSPLVRQTGNVSAGIVFAWFIARSKRMVTVPDEEIIGDR